MFKFLKRLFAKKQPPKQEVIEVKRGGFFSTHTNLGVDPAHSLMEVYAAAMQATFQRTEKDMKVIRKDASTGKDITYAMDEAYPDLQLVKMQNSLYGYFPPAMLGWYGSQAFIGYQLCAMIAQQWMIDKICTMPAQDAIRHGYEITINDGTKVDTKVIDALKQFDKKRGIKEQCVNFIKMGRVFGIRIAMFKIKSSDPKFYEYPFNIDGVTPNSYEGITQIDPYWITPELDAASASDPSSMHFYEPTWWRINGKRVHRTHLIIMRNYGELPDILKPTYFYGGIPTPQKIAERVYAAERTANEAPMLALSKRLTVLNIDITEAMSNLQVFSQKMAAWSAMMNNYGIKIVGENEKIEQFDTSLTDLDAAIMTQFQLVAAAGDVPATKVLGTSPKGFGASGEYEESSYHEFLESLRETSAELLVQRHHLLAIKSYIAPKFAIKPFATEIKWNPTDTPTAKEVAEINNIKAETDNELVQAGGIDSLDVRRRLIADKQSGYDGIEEVVDGGPGDRIAMQEAEAALEAPVTAKAKISEGSDSSEAMFDPVNGRLGDAQLITHQKYLNDQIVKFKEDTNDFKVYVTPEFEVAGKKYRMIIDGHHSLQASVKAQVMPTFVEQVPADGSILNAVKRAAADAAEKKQ